MTIFRMFKKSRKFITDPELFFYDLFRKRLEKRGAFTVRSGRLSKKEILATNFDSQKFKCLGMLGYLRDALGSQSGVRDGYDSCSLLVEQSQIGTTLRLVDSVRAVHPMDVNIYTLDGQYFFKFTRQALGLDRRVSKLLSAVSDFVMELSLCGDDNCRVIHFFVCDASLSGGATLRSGDVWIRKYQPGELGGIFNSRQAEPKPEPIDAVYTWVNSADAEWRVAWQRAFPGVPFDADRYANHDELRFSLRSLGKYATWLSRVYIVSNCAPPSWLSVEHPLIEWVRHEEIFPDLSLLPTFNSHAIESCLHRIKGLSENFIYFNDDFFLTQPCLPGDFFDEYGRAINYFESCGTAYPNEISAETPDYIVATKNSSQLLHDVFKRRPRRLHKHVPYALKRSVLVELESRFSEAFHVTRSSKLRSGADINVTSFLCQHYSAAIGQAVSGDVENFTAKPSNIRRLLNNGSVKYKFICVNDGGNSSNDLAYKKFSRMFFLERYSEKAPWELTN